MLETRAKTARHIPLNNRPEKKVLHDGDRYNEALLAELDLVSEDKLMALENICLNKARVEKVYRLHVRSK